MSGAASLYTDLQRVTGPPPQSFDSRVGRSLRFVLAMS
jgi:hypothetical protein